MAIRKALFSILLGALLIPCTLSHAETYDVLKLPAAPSKLAAKAPMFVVKRFGDRFFAAGAYGHIVYSGDGGKTWTQAEVPVRSTLLDITFVNDTHGWAVGHEGVILHSSDGGSTWELQYDGLRYGTEGLAFYQKLGMTRQAFVAADGSERVALSFGSQKSNLHPLGAGFEPGAGSVSAGSADLCFIVATELEQVIAELGFGGLYVSEDNGGSGLTRLEATFVFEALSMSCPSVAAFLSIHNMCAEVSYQSPDVESTRVMASS